MQHEFEVSRIIKKNSHQSLAAVLRGNEGTPRISLAGVLSLVTGADHVVGDAVAVLLVAPFVGAHSDIDLPQFSGLLAPGGSSQ